MGVDGCGKCMKYSLFASNVLIMIGALTIFAIGIWTLADSSYLENFLGTDLYKSSASIMIAMGVIVIIISFLGCFGAIKEKKCCLLTYFIILFIIFIILLTGGILAYVFRDKVQMSVREKMEKTAMEYGDTDTEGKAYTDAWDNAQTHFECCGVRTDTVDKSWMIWKTNTNVGIGLPKSCCKTAADCGAKDKVFVEDKHYKEGCLEKVTSYFRDHAKILGGVGIGIACIMILGMIFSFCLYRMIE